MNIMLKRSGSVLNKNCVVTHARISGIKFGLRKGSVLPTYNGMPCDWYVSACDDDIENFLIELKQHKCPVRRTMQGTDICVEAGEWEQFGTLNTCILNLGDIPPAQYSGLDFVLKV